MKKTFIIGVLTLLLSGAVFAQDIIVKKDSSTVLCKVYEVSQTDIKYKKWTNQDGPFYYLAISEVSQINYQSGDVDRFSEPNPQPTPTIREEPVYQQEPSTYQPAPGYQPGSSVYQPAPGYQPEPEKPKSPYKRADTQLSLVAGVTFPLGKFAQVSDQYFSVPFNFDADEFETGFGAAKTGFNAAMKIHVPVYVNGKNIIGIPISLGFCYNGIKDQEKKDMRDYYQKYSEYLNAYVFGVNGFSYKIASYPGYLVFPLMAGVDYTHYFTKAFAVYVEGNVGANIGMLTKFTVTNDYGDTFLYTDWENGINYYSETKGVVSYRPKISFAYEVGAGVYFVNCLSLGVYYGGTSAYLVSYKINSYSGYGNSVETGSCQKVQPSTLSVRLGVHF